MTHRLASFSLLVTLVGSAAAEGVVGIDPASAVGPTVDRWGWDLKGNLSLVSNASRAQALYVDVPANLVRIPWFVDAHFSDGSVNTARYASMLTSLNNILAVNPDVEVFASVRLEGGDTFVGPPSEPGWVTAGNENWSFDAGGSIFGNQSNRPNPDFYAQLIADYVSFLDSNGVSVDYLGVNNETDGALGVNRYIGTVDNVRTELTDRGFDASAVTFIGPDTFSPNTAVNITNSLASQGRLDTAQIIGSHGYPRRAGHDREPWEDMSAASGGHDLWHTEVHINPSNANNGSPDTDNIARMRDGLGVLFAVNKAGGGAVDAQGDLIGASSFVWWQGGPNESLIDQTIKREVIKTTLGASPVFTTPDFNEQTTNTSTPLYQAYVEGNEVTLWIANPGAEQIGLAIDLISGRAIDDVHSAPAGEYWQGCESPSGPCYGDFGNTITSAGVGALEFTVESDKSTIVIDSIPYNSVAVLTFDLAGSGDLNGDNQLTVADVVRFQQGWQSGSSRGDLDFDGDTDQTDWFYLRAAFLEAGQGAALAALLTPEPTSLAGGLAVLGWWAAPFWARSRRRGR
ncbi:MAG: hypothetical protein AAGJ46_11260 [Planctomycetota bacterium]